MADLFVNDGGSNTSPYETWAKAAIVFGTAVTASSAGDRLIVGHDHAESPGVNTTYILSGTAAAPNLIISATSTAGGSVVTYNKADNVQIDLSTGVFDINLRGHGKFYGISIKIGDDLIANSSSKAVLYWEDCELELTAGGSIFALGHQQAENTFILKNTNINFSGGNINAGFNLKEGQIFKWSGGTLSWTGTQPTALFNVGEDTYTLTKEGVDLSSITSAFIDISDAAIIIAHFHHCLLNSSVSITTGTIAETGTRILLSGCDDSTGNDLYRLDYIDYWGSTVHDDSIFRDDGTSDGTTNISWKMVSTGNAAEFSEPTVSPPIYSWVDDIAENTFTVNLNWDSASNLQDDEVWLEIEYLEASADTDSAFANDRMTDISSTPVDQTNNTETWTGTSGFTNENQQEVVVTATIGRVGPIIARVYLAKPSTTIYVDPLIVKSTV